MKAYKRPQHMRANDLVSVWYEPAEVLDYIAPRMRDDRMARVKVIQPRQRLLPYRVPAVFGEIIINSDGMMQWREQGKAYLA